MNQEETDNLNRPIASSEIEFVIKKSSQQTKAQDQLASKENSPKHKKSYYLSSNYYKKFKRTEQHSQIHSMRAPLP